MKKSSYKLLDSGDFRKLEEVGGFRISRPSPQAVWSPSAPKSEWDNVDAFYTRFSGGDGKWTVKNKKLPDQWAIDILDLSIRIRLTDFGHLGIFPEQEPNWDRIGKFIETKIETIKDFRVLNLFAYTGIASLKCAKAGAEVVHVDASKTSVAWAKENAELSGLGKAKTRWIVEDVQKFCAREQRRGTKYHGIMLDPPSFGRGTNNEVWKIEEHMIPLLKALEGLLEEDFAFVLLSSHSTGYTPVALRNLVSQHFGTQGEFVADEMLVPHHANKLMLPSGAFCLLTR
jgi:23S rRNA (cytosine1962-C5)-methyltransferase